MLYASAAIAESDSVPIRQLTASGLHFDALSAISEKGELSLDDELSAARSAWALGLADVSRKYWDEALANESLGGDERSKELLGRAILELQEGHFDESRSMAEKSAAALEPGELRANFWLVVAESLRLQGVQAQAEGYYQKAAQESSGETRSEATYLLGECQLRQGRMNDARYSYAGVEAKGKFAVPAIKRLIEIDLNQKSYESVLTWVEEGRSNYPSEFEDPWVGYTSVVSLLEVGRREDAGKELQRLKTRHSEQEPWFQVASASYEARMLKDSLANVGHAQASATKKEGR